MLVASYDPIELTSAWSLPHFFSPDLVESYELLPGTSFSGVDLKIKMTWGVEYFVLLLATMDGTGMLAKLALMPNMSLDYPFYDFEALEWAPLAGLQDYLLRGPPARSVATDGESAYAGHMHPRDMWLPRYKSRVAYVSHLAGDTLGANDDALSTSYDEMPSFAEPYGDMLDEF
jgi:hypothetical protein